MKSFNRRRFFIFLFLVGTCAPIAVFFTNCSQASFEAAEALGDPFTEYAWHLKNTGQKVFATNGGTAGMDLNIAKTYAAGLTGRGVRILISDDGVEDTHQDLSANYLYGTLSKDYTKAYPFLANNAPPKHADDNHGTSVAGLAAAVGNNGFGSKGVAFGATVASANYLSETVTPTETIFLDQVSGPFDVFNMSWGGKQNVISQPNTTFHNKMRSGALDLRDGKGAIYVKAAGNYFFVTCAGSGLDCVGNANFDADNSGPFTILAGALNAKGEAASYSSPGSNLWVSSFGGEYGVDDPAMITTDRSGCDVGFSVSNASGLKFDRGASPNVGCSYVASFNGTSSATPVLSGVVALLLEANPKLTWRDVKYILAKTAVPIYYDTSDQTVHPNSEALPSGAVWEHGWITNGAGFKFHNWYGFGRVDVDAAVALAKKYTSIFGTFIETSFDGNMKSVSLSIPDNSATGVSDTMSIANNVRIESVQLRISIAHTDIGQLGIELISPSGQKSILVNMNNSLTGISNYMEYVLLTNAFYQESSLGTWTLKVYDGKSGISGTVTKWSLRFTGSD
jgi:subtilisin-like proprotein convertase family protein/subtilisin family serine protease